MPFFKCASKCRPRKIGKVYKTTYKINKCRYNYFIVLGLIKNGLK